MASKAFSGSGFVVKVSTPGRSRVFHRTNGPVSRMLFTANVWSVIKARAMLSTAQ